MDDFTVTTTGAAVAAHDAISQFRQAIEAAGLNFIGEIIADGKIHRYRVEGDGAGSKNGWALLHLDGRPAGAFGCKKRFGDASIKWSAKGAGPLTAVARAEILERTKQRRADEAEAHELAAQRAQELWDAAVPCEGHTYLLRKGVESHGLRIGPWDVVSSRTGDVTRVSDAALLIPIRDAGKRIWSLQAIFPDSDNPLRRQKDFLTGGAKRGLFFTLGKPVNNIILIAEGFATAATVHEATGHAVVVSFDAGNMQPVAEVIREKFADARVVVCADNDAQTPGNPGRTAAHRAAAAVGGAVAMPEFDKQVPGLADVEGAGAFTDWNDFAELPGRPPISPHPRVGEVLRGYRRLALRSTIERAAGRPSPFAALIASAEKDGCEENGYRSHVDPDFEDRLGADPMGFGSEAVDWLLARIRATAANANAGEQVAAAEEPETQAPLPMRVVSLADLATATLEPPPFWIHGILPANCVTLLGAHGGSGKSTLACTIGAHLAGGKWFYGLRTKPARVAFVSLEDDAEVVRYRLRQICETFGLDMVEVGRHMVILDGTDFGALASEFNEHGVRVLVGTAAMEQIEGMRDVDIFIIDNASDAFDGNENERRHVRTFIRRLANLARRNGGAVLLLAHVAKDSAKVGGSRESYSGSTAWHNSCRSRLALSGDGELVKLEHQKSNFGRCIDPIYFQWVEPGVLMPAAAPDVPADEASPGKLENAVLEAIGRAQSGGTLVPTATAGAKTAAAVLREMLGGRVQPRALNAALVRLELAHQIQRVGRRGKDHKTREYWSVPAQAA